MKINKRQKGILFGSFWGIASQLIMTVLTFVTRSIFLRYFTIELLGYNTLFADLIGFLNIAELGLGTSITLALYKPVLENDYYKTTAIVQMLKKIYKIIGLIVLLIGGLLVGLLPYFVKTPIIDLSYLRTAFFMYVFNQFIMYFFMPYQNFLSVLQRGYVVEIVTAVGHILSGILKLTVLVLTKNYLLFVLLQFVGTIAVCFYYPLYIKKQYPYLHENRHATLKKDEGKQLVKNSFQMIYYKLSLTVVYNAGNIITSSFLGIAMVGYFSNYKNIIAIAGSLIQRVLMPISNALGSFTAERSVDETLEKLNILSFFCFVSGTIMCCLLAGLLDPFIVVWLGKEYLFNLIPILIAMYNMYLLLALTPISDIFNISGCYTHHRYIPIIEIIVNLSISLILVNFFDLAGILLGTTFCHIISYILKSRAVFGEFFKKNVSPFLIRNVIYFTLSIVLSLSTLFITQTITFDNAWTSLLVYLPICIVLPLAVIIPLFWRSNELTYFKNILSKLVRKIH